MTKMNGLRGLAAALLISIALNLFFIGGIASVLFNALLNERLD